MEVLIRYDEPGTPQENIRSIECRRENESVGGFREDAIAIVCDLFNLTIFELFDELDQLDGNTLICRKP